MSHFHILPECYADTLLVEALGFNRPNHQSGIGNVLKVFEKNFGTRPAIGVIDDDKIKPKNFNRSFKEIDRQAGIRKMAAHEKPHFLLVICPAFENWIFDNAKTVDVSPPTYGFQSPKYFRTICKRQDASRNQQLQAFLNALKQKNAPGLHQLKTWLTELNTP